MSLPSCFSTAAGQGGCGRQSFSAGSGNARLASRPSACGLEEPWLKVSGGPSWLGLPGLAVEGPVFKFRVTVSVAPRPEDCAAKLGRAVGVGAGCTWAVRDGKQKLTGQVLQTREGTKGMASVPETV